MSALANARHRQNISCYVTLRPLAININRKRISYEHKVCSTCQPAILIAQTCNQGIFKPGLIATIITLQPGLKIKLKFGERLLQRKLLTPNHFPNKEILYYSTTGIYVHYNLSAKPIEWSYTVAEI